MHFLKLFHRYIIRDLLKNRARLALTIAGIALGISVVVAVQLANDRAISSFNDSLGMLAGQTDLEITANGLPLTEDLMTKLSWLWDSASMAPVILGRGVLEQDPVQIFGIDLLSENNFREYFVKAPQNESSSAAETGEVGAPARDRTQNGGPDQRNLTEAITRDDFIELLLNPRNAIITSALADRRHLSKGSPLVILIGDRVETLTVGAVLDNNGAARAFSGDVIFLDIAAAQLALHKIGYLDRIDVRLRNHADIDEVRKKIQSALPATAAVDAPESAAVQNEKLLRAFRYNLTALSYISLIVGVILVYNTMTIAVIRRRAEIGMLRTMGAARGTIAFLFLIEAAFLGLAGALIGMVFGELMARAAGVMVTRTIEGLYTGVFALPTAGAAAPRFYIEVAALGVLLSMVSGLAPALRATGVSPAAILRRGIAVAGRGWRPNLLAAVGAAIIAAAMVVGRQPPVFGFPFFGYAAAVLLILGFGFLAPAFSQLLVALLSRPLRALVPIEGRLATQSMRANLGRIVTAVLSLTIATAMLVSVVTMVSSFRDTVVVWINQTLQADLYIRAAAAGPNDWSNPFDPGTVAGVASLPGVEAIDRYRGRPITFNGSPIVLAAGELTVLGAHSDLLFMDRRSASDIAPRLLNQDRVIVSEPFSIKQRMGKGDVVRLPTAEGVRPFEIEAVYYDYSNDRGVVTMDRSTYLRLFHDTSVTNIATYLKPGVGVAEAQEEVARSLPNAQLRVLTNGDLKRQVLRVFDQTFQVTYALEAIALIVAILGITNTLSALILERRPEFAMLRFVGADRRQLRKVVILESGLIGLAGALLGLALGIALSVVLVFVINKQSFGWTIQFVVPGWFFVQSLGMIVLATLAAGLYPARLVLRMDPIQSIRAE